MDLLDDLEDLAIMLNLDNDDDLANEIVKYYVIYRTKDLLNNKKVTEDEYKEIVEGVMTNFFLYDISIDLMINSVYNYIEKNKKCPTTALLNDDITVLLENYCTEI